MKQTAEQKGAAVVRRAAAHVAGTNPDAAKTLLALVPNKPKAEPKERVLQPMCPETKKDGSPCTARCAKDKKTCVDHQPAWDRLTHEEHQRFGAWLRKAKAADVVDVIGWFRAKQIAADTPMPEAKQSKSA